MLLNRSPKAASVLVALFALAPCLSLSQGIALRWSNTYLLKGYALTPTNIATSRSNAADFRLFTAAYSKALLRGISGTIVVSLDTSSPIPIGSGLLASAPSVTPVAIVNNSAFADIAAPGLRLLGARVSSFSGTQTAYYGGNTSPISGPLDYAFPSTDAKETPLCLGQFPFTEFAVSGTPVASPQRGLEILYTAPNATNPTRPILDSAINPSAAISSGELIVAAGRDNSAGVLGGARLSSYKVVVGGTATSVSTKTVPNTLVGNVATSHSLVLGGLSGSFYVVVDNQTLQSTVTNAQTYQYRVYAFGATGNQLWVTEARPGWMVQVSVGSERCIYGLTTRVPGQQLVALREGGVVRWSRSTKAVRIAAALEQGVVAADQLVDGTGQKHIHFQKFTLANTVAYSQTYASDPTWEDTITDLRWNSGRVFLLGQCAPGDGRIGLFGAQYDQF